MTILRIFVMGSRYDVQIITNGRHIGWREFTTESEAQAFCAERGGKVEKVGAS